MPFVHVDYDLFARVTLIFVAVPTVLSLAFLWAVSRSQSANGGSDLRGPRAAPCILALLAGFASAAGWLTRNDHYSIIDSIHLGAPTEFPKYQVIGCGITLVLFSMLVTLRSRSNLFGAAGVTVCTAAGFATAFALDASTYDVASQEGIGVVFAYFGVGFLVLLTNVISVAGRTVRSRNRTKNR